MWNQWWSYYDTLVQHGRDDFGVYELADGIKNTVYYETLEFRAIFQKTICDVCYRKQDNDDWNK